MDKQRDAPNDRFLQIISAISDHIYVGDVSEAQNPRSYYFSPHLEALTGYPTEDFMADWHFWPSLIHPEDRAGVLAQFERAAKSGHSEVEYRLLRADGNIIWVRDSRRVEIETDQAGQVQQAMVYGVVSDITQRREDEAEIQALNERLEQRVNARTRSLAALYEIAAITSESLQLPVALEKALDCVLAVTENEIGAIHLCAEGEAVFELATQRNLPPPLLAQIDFLPGDGGLAKMVIEHDEPLLIPDLATIADLDSLASNDSAWSYLGVPMRARRRVVGLLSLFGRNRQPFTLEEGALLASIARHIGAAVENDRLNRRAEQAAVMEERERLARELHDAVTQSLCSLTLFAEAGWEMAKSGELETIQHNFTRMGETAQYALKEMRLLLHELRPPDLERNGLVGALRHRLESVEKRANIKTNLLVEELGELPAPIEEGLYRIAQEALNNALKHAAAQAVTVYLKGEGNEVVLEITDTGRGFYPNATEHMGGLGLTNMKKRTALLGGSLQIHSEIEQGTQIRVRVKI